MELSRKQINMTKGIAIVLMILLHLFCTKEYVGLYKPLIFIGEIPLVYYLALFGDCCVVIYCFCSGYGLFLGYKNDSRNYVRKNLLRIKKLLMNYWVIIFVFVIVLGFLLGRGDEFPGNIKDLILTITTIDPKYNGAWWFVTTYILLVLISPILNKIVLKKNNYIVMIVAFLIYCIGYIQRIKVPIVFNNEILDLIIRQLALLGTSQLPFIIGCIFANKKIYSKIYKVFNRFKFKNTICIFIIIGMIIGHGVIETLFISIFTGIIFICVFNLIDKSIRVEKVLDYLGNHSTNLWLTHMFFYMIYFKNIIYGAKYSFIILPWLIFLCIISSYIINWVNRKLIAQAEQVKIEILEIKL